MRYGYAKATVVSRKAAEGCEGGVRSGPPKAEPRGGEESSDSRPERVADAETPKGPSRANKNGPRAREPGHRAARTFVYLNKAGEKYLVYHETQNRQYSWEHPYDTRGECSSCR